MSARVLKTVRDTPPGTPRYQYKREGLRWVVRAGTGTRPLFKVWRQRTALVLCTELLGAFLDGDFARREKMKGATDQ